MSDRLNHRIALQAEAAAAAGHRIVRRTRHGNTGRSAKASRLCCAQRVFCNRLYFSRRKANIRMEPCWRTLRLFSRQLGLLRDEEDIVAHVARLSTGDYLTWTRIADRSAAWHKRFAQALVTRTKESH